MPGKAGGTVYRPLELLGVREMESLRVILRGGSVVDWRRLRFKTREEVDHFLKLNLCDLKDPHDEKRLRAILTQSVDYLRNAFGYKVADAVAKPADVRDVFLLASGAAEPQRYRRIACVTLKCMHVVHHLEARELLFRTAVREMDLADRVEKRVMAEGARMREAGFPILEFQGSVKPRSSLITKLIAKKETVAAQIFDRIRFRVVTERLDQIPGVLAHFTENLFPFNYVVPGQTQNSLLRFRNILAQHPRAGDLVEQFQLPIELDAGIAAPHNEFSGHDFRVLNFVVDLPVRIDDFIVPGDPEANALGRVVFLLVEFQIVDVATAKANDLGESNHERYKKRQLKKVLRRLSRGLVVPKKR
jgi:uncharacterized protein (TIGR04552 family)